jgi:putative DNA primase/helicase
MNTKQAAIGRWPEIFKYYGLPEVTGKNHFKGMPAVWTQRQIPLR